MSALSLYFERTVKGMETYFSHDKTVVLLLLVLLVLWLGDKKKNNETHNRLLVYTTVISLALLFPVTAIVAVIYQSAYYDYEWVWSMVPVVAVVGYGAVRIYEMSEREKKGRLVWWLGLLLLLFFCGNQGCLKTATEEETKTATVAKGLVATVENAMDTEEPVLWGPKGIMQEVRREAGGIRLVYGKDMWDPKAGAYDYEAYSQELIRAYEWMESVCVLASEPVGEQETVLYEKYDIPAQLPEVVSYMMDSGVNVIVLPDNTVENLDKLLTEAVEKANKNVQKEYVEQYVVYLLK